MVPETSVIINQMARLLDLSTLAAVKTSECTLQQAPHTQGQTKSIFIISKL
jgi:hypothetical protein